MKSVFNLNIELGRGLEVHPIATMLTAALHGINSFLLLTEAGQKANPELVVELEKFVGNTLIAFGNDYLERSEASNDGEEAGQTLPTTSGDVGGESR